MRVLWICHFSNSEIRNELKPKPYRIENKIRRRLKRPEISYSDFAQWITNGIKEFEQIEEVELHVVAPHYGMKEKAVSFKIRGVYYHFFRPDDNFFIKRILMDQLLSSKETHSRNRKLISDIINKVNPDIIHMYGAENPYYSLSALDINLKKHPLLVSLQTLMSVPEFKDNYPISEESYNFRSGIERKILEYAKYIGTTPPNYRQYIRSNINVDKEIFKAYLAVCQEIEITNAPKQYDFVYFSADISKASDMAIEGFALAHKKHPDITLNIVGSMSEPFTSKLKKRIKELGIEKQVYFSGRLPEHKDVLNQIQLSRFALLPLKIDILAGTIREAMFAKMPVVSTITPGTPSLNDDRMSILLSEQGDYETMATQMIQLIEDPSFAEQLKENAFITINERWSNKKDMSELVEVYEAIINNHKHGIDIPEKFNTKNTNN